MGPVSNVRHVSIYVHDTGADLGAIAAAAGVTERTDTYGLQLNVINARVQMVPGIKNSAVRRLPNGNLAVRANLHQAVALWSDGESYFPLSADGTIVNDAADTRAADTVVFRGELPADIAQITKAAAPLVDHIDYMQWIEGRRWDIYTTGGIRIMLPENGAELALGTLTILNNNNGILGKKLRVIDMRDDARILVK